MYRCLHESPSVPDLTVRRERRQHASRCALAEEILHSHSIAACGSSRIFESASSITRTFVSNEDEQVATIRHRSAVLLFLAAGMVNLVACVVDVNAKPANNCRSHGWYRNGHGRAWAAYLERAVGAQSTISAFVKAVDGIVTKIASGGSAQAASVSYLLTDCCSIYERAASRPTRRCALQLRSLARCRLVVSGATRSMCADAAAPEWLRQHSLCRPTNRYNSWHSIGTRSDERFWLYSGRALFSRLVK